MDSAQWLIVWMPSHDDDLTPHIIDRMIRTLLFSTLYPYSVRPSHGIGGVHKTCAARALEMLGQCRRKHT